MLNTINGFDLLLIITIVVMGFKIYNLNRECESYVGQILRLSWELSGEYNRNNPPFGYDEPVVHKHEYQSYCDCNKCIPF